MNDIIYFVFRYYPCDPPYVTDEVRQAEAYQTAMDKLKAEMETLQKEMQNSVPFYSCRYKVIYALLFPFIQRTCEMY